MRDGAVPRTEDLEAYRPNRRSAAIDPFAEATVPKADALDRLADLNPPARPGRLEKCVVKFIERVTAMLRVQGGIEKAHQAPIHAIMERNANNARSAGRGHLCMARKRDAEV